MVVIKKFTVKATAVAAAVSIASFPGCGKYEDGPGFSLKTKKSRLKGEWELDKFTDASDGTVITSTDLEWEFEKDGDFSQTLTIPPYIYTYYGYTYSFGGGTYTSNGDWEWENSKESIEITIGNIRSEFEILRLTNKELVLEDEDRDQWEFEKK